MTAKSYEWAQNLVDPKYPSSIKISTSNTLPFPPGFEPSNESNNKEPTLKINEQSQSNFDDLQIQKAWQIALQPIKSIPMNFFMAYMSGTSLQIIPIMTALMLLSGPIKAMFTTKQQFKPVLGNARTTGTIKLIMCLFIAGQCAQVYIGLRKLNQMGLIPNTSSDWLAWEPKIDYGKYIKSIVS